MTLIRRILSSGRRWWPQACAVILGLSAGLLYTAITERAYTAQAYVVVVADAPSSLEQTRNFAQAFTRVATQPSVLSAALRPELPSRTVSQLQRSTRVSASPDAPLIGLSASAPTAEQAAAQANALAQALISYAGTHTGDTGVRIASMSRASAPDEPSSPMLSLNLAVGGAAGLLLAGLFYLAAPGTRRPGGRQSGHAPAGRSRERASKRSERV